MFCYLSPTLHIYNYHHPLAMSTTLLSQTIVICVTSGLSTKSMWLSYILFLLFLGAMLVLFIYVASLASNEAFTISMTLTLGSLLLFFLGSMFWMFDLLLPLLKATIESSFLETSQFLFSTQATLSMIYNPSSANLTLFIILYRLLTLIVVVKITSTFFGLLRFS